MTDAITGNLVAGCRDVIGGRLYMLAFALRGEAMRPISLRRANERERRSYGRR